MTLDIVRGNRTKSAQLRITLAPKCFSTVEAYHTLALPTGRPLSSVKFQPWNTTSCEVPYLDVLVFLNVSCKNGCRFPIMNTYPGYINNNKGTLEVTTITSVCTMSCLLF